MFDALLAHMKSLRDEIRSAERHAINIRTALGLQNLPYNAKGICIIYNRVYVKCITLVQESCNRT